MNLLVRVVRHLRRLLFVIRSFRASVLYGRDFVVGRGVSATPGTRIRVADRVNIASGVSIQTHLEIGDDVMISSRVAFIGDDHDFSDPLLTIQEQDVLPKAQVVLDGDNLIGFGTIVLGSVRIGRGAIVGAGSLVTKDLPPNSICVGRPAKPIRARR